MLSFFVFSVGFKKILSLYFQITCRQAECEYPFLLKQPCPKYHRTLRFHLSHYHTLYQGGGLNSDLLTESQKYHRSSLTSDPSSENFWGFGSGTSISPTPSGKSDVQATLGTTLHHLLGITCLGEGQKRSFPLTYTYCSDLSFLTCTMRIFVLQAILQDCGENQKQFRNFIKVM